MEQGRKDRRKAAELKFYQNRKQFQVIKEEKEMSIKRFRIVLDGEVHEVEVEEVKAGGATSAAVPSMMSAAAAAPAASQAAAPKAASKESAPAAAEGETLIKAPLQGKVSNIAVTAGQQVSEGEILIIIEAMKMENEIVAPKAGVVKSISCSKDDAVASGDPLMVIA